jgi:site-specific DNA-cytosine methylase
MKYLNIVPLVGGMTIANQLVTGQDPAAILSYSPFQSNDSHIVARNPQVPYILFDEPDGWKNPEYDKSIFENLDFVTTVCPCAGLSMYSSGKKGYGAIQNQWMYDTANHVLESLRPRVFFGENAPGLYSAMGSQVANDLYEIGQQHGYSFSIYRTNTTLHGIPQSRVRTFYFYWDNEEAPVMNWYSRDRKNLKEYLAEVPDSAPYQSAEHKIARKKTADSDYTWAWLTRAFGEGEGRKLMKDGNYNSIFDFADSEGLLDGMVDWLTENGYEKGAKRTAAIRDKIKKGGNYWDNSFYIFRDEFNALISRSMTAIHPVEDRSITLREAMHLMGLPHDFELTDEKLAVHITQNVPVTTAADMTREVLAYLNGERMSSGCKFYKQDNTSHNFEEVVTHNSLEEFFE